MSTDNLKKREAKMQFPLSESFNQNYIQVSSLHELWYAEYGNPKGIPVIVLHGIVFLSRADVKLKNFVPHVTVNFTFSN